MALYGMNIYQQIRYTKRGFTFRAGRIVARMDLAQTFVVPQRRRRDGIHE